MIRLASVLLLLVAAAPAWAVRPALVVKRFSVDIDLHADGTASVIEEHRRIPASDAAAAEFGQMSLGFSPGLSSVDVLEAYTLKRDGRRIDLDPAQIRAQATPGVPNVPTYSDEQSKVVIFPDLAGGDTEVLRYRHDVLKPLLPGFFFWVRSFPRLESWEDASFRVRRPKGMKLTVEAVGMTEETEETDTQTIQTWHYRNTDVVAEDLAAVSDWQRLPRILVSTLPDYASLGELYAEAEAPEAVVTPKVQALADEIIGPVTERRAQARAIYEWVSRHIRYVNAYLGTGSVVPHPADEVIANGYGDCKDHAVLFQALLRARGITAETVLINLGDAYTLSAAPTLVQLDHAISYLPEFDLYVDTTTGVAPFGVLPFQEYGKPVVIAALGKAEVRTLPVLPAGLATITTTTDATMQLDGSMIGTSTIRAGGPAAIALRLAARQVLRLGHEGAARRQLERLGEQGTGRFVFAPPDGFAPDFAVSGQFQLEALPEILEGDSFAPPLGLQLLVRPGDYFLGPLHRPTLPVTEDTPCFSGRQVEELRLEVPEGRAPTRLPKDIDVRTAQFTYHAHWQVAGQVITVRRELVAAFEGALCHGELRREVAAAMVQIRRDQRAKVVLADAP